LLTLKLLL